MRPPERLAVTATLAVSLVLAAFRPAGAGTGLFVLAAALLITAGIALLVDVGGRLGLLRDVSPFALLVTLYTQLKPTIEALNDARYDGLFARLDDRYLGALVRIWRGALGRPDAFTDAVYLAYVSFYFMPVAVLLAVRASRDRGTFERAAFTVLFGFILSYVGYLFWPTSGPRLSPAEEVGLGGGPVSQAVRAFLRSAGVNTLDAFPSGHTALSMLSAWIGSRLFPRAAPFLWAWSGAIVFSTIYVHVHYVCDLFGGVLLFGLTLLVVPAAWRLMSGSPSPSPRTER